MFKYADDILVVIPVNDASPSNINDKLNEEIMNVTRWCESSSLIVNQEKTKIMLVKKRSTPSLEDVGISVPTIPQMRILGVQFQDDLRWDAHIENICKASSRYIYVLKQLKKIGTSKAELIQVYNAIIRGVIEYSSPLFVGLTKRNSNRLEKIQKRCHRIICDYHCSCGILTPLHIRRETAAVRLFRKMIDPSHQLHHLVPPLLPSNRRIAMPLCETVRRRQTFIPIATMLYNKNA